MPDLKVVKKPRKKTRKTQGTLRADTVIEVVIDMSGSMGTIREATMEGYNAFIAGQRKEKGRVLVSLILFDSEFNMGAPGAWSQKTRIIRPYTALPLEEVPELTADVYCPSGGTPLRDAVGTGIEDISDVLQRIPKKDNPDVLVVIITDGGENRSQRFSASEVRGMVEQCEGKGWTFVYMGADQDSWAETESMGFTRGNVMNYDKTDIQGGAFAKVACATTHYRATSRDLKVKGLCESYTTTAFFDDAGVKEDEPVNVTMTSTSTEEA